MPAEEDLWDETRRRLEDNLKNAAQELLDFMACSLIIIPLDDKGGKLKVWGVLGDTPE